MKLQCTVLYILDAELDADSVVAKVADKLSDSRYRQNIRWFCYYHTGVRTTVVNIFSVAKTKNQLYAIKADIETRVEDLTSMVFFMPFEHESKRQYLECYQMSQWFYPWWCDGRFNPSIARREVA